MWCFSARVEIIESWFKYPLFAKINSFCLRNVGRAFQKQYFLRLLVPNFFSTVRVGWDASNSSFTHLILCCCSFLRFFKSLVKVGSFRLACSFCKAHLHMNFAIAVQNGKWKQLFSLLLLLLLLLLVLVLSWKKVVLFAFVTKPKSNEMLWICKKRF